MYAGKQQRRKSELNSLGGGVEEEAEGEEMGGGRRPQRRAAKNLARNVYSMDINEEIEYADSPASAGSAKDTPPAAEPTTLSTRKRAVRRKDGGVEQRGRGGGKAAVGGAGRDGRGAGEKGRGKVVGPGMKVPPMKIKLIGRTGESDSPIFFAESLGEVHVHVVMHVHVHVVFIHMYTI